MRSFIGRRDGLRLGDSRLGSTPGPCFAGGAGLAWANLAGGNALHAWDFLVNQARWNGSGIGPVSNTPNWTFTRASTGYAQTSAGALTAFASGELRRTDKGVLIEGARTNLCLQSQTFDNASWTSNQSSVSANATTAPDGTSTADLLTEDSTAGAVHRATQSLTTTAAAHTASVYVKPNGRTWVYMRMADNTSTPRRCYFNCSGSGSVGTAESGMTGSIAALANGWYRISATIGTALAGANFLVFGLSSADNTETYNGDGTSGIYLWGAQLEAASFPSSYIPTTTASATRAADTLKITGLSGLTHPLSLYCEIERVVDIGAVAEGLVATYADGSNFAELFVSSANNATCATTGGGSKASAASVALGVTSKIAGRCATNDVNVALNGVAAAADTTATMPSNPTEVWFGEELGTGVSSRPFCYIRRAAIWNRALSDSELQSVST
mgnify:CR=1 FL=1